MNAVMAMAVQDKFAPVKRTDGYALTDARLDWHLENWAVWESSRWDAELAFEVSQGVSSSVDFEEMCAEMDRRCAAVTAAAIASLTPVERAAVCNKFVAAVFRFPRENQQNAWIRARWRLAIDLYRRGLV
jgi:hypothetical protein